MSKEIILIRHGETDENKRKITQGREINSHLNNTGKQQAVITGKYLKKFKHKPSIIFTSPLHRAYETADIICEELGFKKNARNFIVNENLIETTNGLLNETRNAELEASKYYASYKKMENTYLNILDPIKKNQYLYKSDVKKTLSNLEADTMDDIEKRSKAIIHLIHNCPKKKIMMISHNGIIKQFLNYIFGLCENAITIDYYKKTKNCHITKISYDANATSKFKLLSKPNTMHFKTFTNFDETIYETTRLVEYDETWDEDKFIYEVTDGEKIFLLKPEEPQIKKKDFKKYNIKSLVSKNKYGFLYQII